MTSTRATVESSKFGERIAVLDVLRGIAILGMFLVHFNYLSSNVGRLDAWYKTIAILFFEGRFATMFGILFGVSFALQFRRIAARRSDVVGVSLRRIAGLAVIGLAAQAFFGFYVLLLYAVWALPLFAIRNWSTRALLILLAVCSVSGSAFRVARSAYGVASVGETSWVAKVDADRAKQQQYVASYAAALRSPDYASVVAFRVRDIPHMMTQPWFLLPSGAFTLFVLGLLALRLGLVEHTRDKRAMILGLMAFGALSWLVNKWLLPLTPTPTDHIMQVILTEFRGDFFGILRSHWLAVTYIGAILLVGATMPQWLNRLAPFGWAGRMALTNCFIHFAVLDFTVREYGLGLSLRYVTAAALAIALFAVAARLSRWWLQRFKYGPIEWLWRWATYGVMPTLRIAPVAATSAN